MAELATIARPYAEALFKASGSNVTATAAWVEGLGAIAQDEQLLQLAANPNVTVDQVFELISSVMSAPLSAQAQNFLRAVIENGRLSALPEVALQFRELANAQSGSSDAVVYSAFPLDAAALSDVAALLEKRFDRKLNVAVVLQADLIGGIRVVVGDEVLDMSVKARLEQMKMALTA
jgi:F-type H+-transporting ATPase subunit delta